MLHGEHYKKISTEDFVKLKALTSYVESFAIEFCEFARISEEERDSENFVFVAQKNYGFVTEIETLVAKIEYSKTYVEE